VDHKPAISIRFAVASCLVRCQLTDAQLTCLQDFAEELETAGWDGPSIKQVKRCVLISLYGDKAAARLGPERDGELA
jgi:hypothetical protein